MAGSADWCAAKNSALVFVEFAAVPRSRVLSAQGFFAKVLGFFCCVGLPAFISAIAPISVTHFVRENERVTAHASTRVFYAIPYRRVTIDDVTAVDDRFHEGELLRRSSSDSGFSRRQRAEDESFLVIHGRDAVAEIPTSPINIRGLLQQANEFLKHPERAELKLTSVANWKFGVVIPLILSPLALLYIVGLMLTIGRFFVRLTRKV